MPELPEVETIARQLDKALKGKKIADIEVLKRKSFLGQEKDLFGKTIEEVDRKSKMVIFKFDKTNSKLLVHLKMSGQLIFRGDGKNIAGGHPTADWVNTLPSKFTRVIIDFADGTKLFFNDMRIFGWMKLLSETEYEKLMTKLPPDVTDIKFSEEYFGSLFTKTSKAVKLVLMDQEKIGGVGNIYANDALWLSKIDPRKPAKNLTLAEIKELYKAVKNVIEKGIKYGGASADQYVQTTGLGGTYQEHFLVYNRDKQKCSRDGETIKKIKLGGRGTYFCPKCQV